MPLDVAALLKHPESVRQLSSDQLPVLLLQLAVRQSELAALQSALTTRLLESSPDGARDGDMLLTVDAVAAQLSVSEDWIYRNAIELPFTVRVGHHLRFSSLGLQRFMRQRQGRS